MHVSQLLFLFAANTAYGESVYSDNTYAVVPDQTNPTNPEQPGGSNTNTGTVAQAGTTGSLQATGSAMIVPIGFALLIIVAVVVIALQSRKILKRTPAKEHTK